MKKLIYIIPFLALLASSCIKDEDSVSYTEWKAQNEEYMLKMQDLTENGQKVYTKITPDWAPGNYVLIKWHNDRALTADNLKPLSNSTVNIKYEMEDIEGKSLGNSYSSTTYGDSIYQSMPNENIVGMWIALTNMHVGDTVTMVIPAGSAYGANSAGSIKPYSALIYHVKMKGVPKYEK